MHVYYVIDVKGGLKGWTVLRIGGSERLKGKGNRYSYTKGKKNSYKTRNTSIKHKSLGIKSSFWG